LFSVILNRHINKFRRCGNQQNGYGIFRDQRRRQASAETAFEDIANPYWKKG
jgi:hypothetical protein